jgi:hypothetical protein
MSDKFSFCDDDLYGDSMLDSCAAAGTSVQEPEDSANATDEWTGAHCEKCDAWLVSDVVSICRQCGWYASLGQFVEVDPSWELDSEPEQAPVAAPRTSHLQVWLGMLPQWAWIIVGSVLVLIVESAVPRFITPADSWVRTTWSLGQLAIGLLAAIGCHVFNFLVLTADDSEIGLLDLMLKPLKLWGRAVENLPTRLWVVNAAVSGLVAALLSVLVIGGIPYDRLWDWGVKQPPKQDLMGAIMDQVQKVDGNGEDDLEKSIHDFAGKNGEESADKRKADPPKPRQTADCVVLGFQLDRDGRLASLVLGTASSGQLVYAGNVSLRLGDDEMRSLTQSLQSIVTKRPLLHIELEATWVKPSYACRVNFGERAKNGRLRDIEWNTMLGNIQSRTRGK